MKTHSVSSEVPAVPGKRCSLADSFQGVPTMLRKKLALPTGKAEVLAPPGPLPSCLLLCALRASCTGGSGSSLLLASRGLANGGAVRIQRVAGKWGVLCLGHHGSGPSHHCQFHAAPASQFLGAAPSLALQRPLAVAWSQLPCSVLRSLHPCAFCIPRALASALEWGGGSRKHL